MPEHTSNHCASTAGGVSSCPAGHPRLRASECSIGGWGSHMGPSWAKLATSWSHNLAKLGQLGTKLGLSWAKLGPKMGPSWTILKPSWAILGPKCGQDGLPRRLRTRKSWVWHLKTKMVEVHFVTQTPMRRSPGAAHFGRKMEPSWC